MSSRMESFLLKLLHFLAWFLDRFFISDRSKDDDYNSSRSEREFGGSAHGDKGNDNIEQGKESLQEALKLFEIDSLEDKEITRETIRKKYLRMSLTYHPDRNNGSPESKEKMQQVNLHYETINRELDRRDGAIPSEDIGEKGESNGDKNESSPAEPKPFSKEERRRRKKERRREWQEAKRRLDEELKHQREEREEALRQQRQEMERQKREFMRYQKKLKQNTHKLRKAYFTGGLNIPEERLKAFLVWERQAASYLGQKIENNDKSEPKNPVMEYSTHEIAMAIRAGKTEVAVELVHDEIGYAVLSWIRQNPQQGRTHHPRRLCFKMNDRLRDAVLVNVLLAPLDDDSNNVLQYAAYFQDDELISYFVQEARHWERFEKFVTSQNAYGFDGKIYASLVGNKLIEDHFERLTREVDEIIESRKLIPTFRRLVAQFGKAPSLVPFLLSTFGVMLGLVVFETGWFVGMAIVLKTVGHEDYSKTSIRQRLCVDPSVFPGDMLTWHAVWLVCKVFYSRLSSFVPLVSDYWIVSIPLLAIAWGQIPATYHLLPIYSVTNSYKESSFQREESMVERTTSSCQGATSTPPLLRTRTTTLRRCCHWLVSLSNFYFLFLTKVSSVEAGLNLNFRSQQLSNIKGAKNDSQSSSDGLRLDLSGRMQILLAGSDAADRLPQLPEETQTSPPPRIMKPILVLPPARRPWHLRQVHLALDYDFNQSALGVLRLGPTLLWNAPTTSSRNQRAMPRQVELAIEKGIASGVQNAVEAFLCWKPSRNSDSSVSPTLRCRCHDSGLVSVSCSLPLHRRISYQAAISHDLWGERTRLAFPDVTTTHQDWWLPQLFISPLGVMKAHKQVWLDGQTMASQQPQRWGIRLAVRRQLEWSLWNTAPSVDDDTPSTVVSLQVEGATSSWRAGVRLESTLEEPIGEARATLSTHVHTSRPTN